MSERIEIGAMERTVVGKKSRSLRASGQIPAIIYGRSEALKIQLEEVELMRTLKAAGGATLIDIDVTGEKHIVLAREVQRHATKRNILHVDFYEVDMKATIKVNATLVGVGESVPETDGLGSTSMVIHVLTIETTPDLLISEIEVDLTQIEKPNDMIFVRDLPIPEGVKVLANPNQVVARFEYTRIVEEEETVEDLLAPAADDVEVISKGKADEEEIEE